MWIGTLSLAVLLILIILTGEEGGRLDFPTVAVLLGVTVVGSLLLWRLTSRWGRAVLAETWWGYTTSPFTLGRFWLRPAPGAPWTVGWVGWDFSGVWVLEPNGRPRSQPQPGVLPPGFYPSPHAEDQWELWTGSQWSNWIRSSPEDA